MVEQGVTEDMIKTIEELLKINKILKISIEELSLTKKIGEGGQAKVYKGTFKGESVAVKILSEVDMKCLAHEIVILSNLSHKNIPKFYGMVLEENIIGLVTQCISGKTLDECKLSEFTKDQKFQITKSIASALAYVHSIKFIHRDLKPENVLIEDKTKTVFLIDFGIAKVITNTNETLTRAKGTLYYLAPETFDVAELTDDQEIICYVTTKVDVWAFGCIISYLYSGKLPWTNKYKKNASLIQDLLIKKTHFPIPDSITDETVKKVISLATEVEYTKRCSMEDLKTLLEKSEKEK